MEYILENSEARVVISTKAAEIHSFVAKDNGIEMMWNGNPEYWAGRNPILFPQVGNTYNKTQVFKGKEYHMGNHGLARNAEFSFVSSCEDSLTLSLKADENTMSLYPYDFELQVRYQLIGKRLEINYTITNNDEETMPFGFGLHPAFNCPADNGAFEDYYIEFSSKEGEDTDELKLIKDHKLSLNRELFDKYKTVVYYNLNSAFVTLTNGRHGVKITCAGYPILAIWSPANAPFVCIEPWHSHGDFAENNIPFEEREGIISLESGRSFLSAYSIELI